MPLSLLAPRARSLAVVAAAVALAACKTHGGAPPPGSSGDPARTGGEPAFEAAVVLDARAKVAVHVDPAVMSTEDKENIAVAAEGIRRPEEDRIRVRESVKDLARVLASTSGASVEIVTEPPPKAADGVYRIVIGAWAEAANGPVGASAPYAQGFRVVVGKAGAAMYGESGLATSYAIYELLDRVGCRWFIPGDLGEVLPKPGPLALPRMDERRAPSTIYRGVWYADDAWKRRNRQGGLLLDAGHALELRYVTDADRRKHPEWRATIGGKPHPSRLKWSSETLAHHVADRIRAMHAEDGAPSYSLAPDDGGDFDESPADKALDAGDFDPTMNMTSITDRFVVLANRIATDVGKTNPDLLFGFLAYVHYTRPPVRETLHPNLVPQIAPITYARAHPMSDDRVPGNKDLRAIIEGWGRRAREVSMYFYGWFLSEPVAPNPMIARWGHDVPFALANNVKLWQPETLPTFESNLHALYLGMRLAFDARRKPADVIADLERRFYGAAAPAMHDYWQYVDRLWVDTPEYSGGAYGHARRFTGQKVVEMRALLEKAKAAAETDAEKKRVELADDSLSLFEDFMGMRWSFVEGKLAGLDRRGEKYKKRATELAEKWKSASAFAKTDYLPGGIYAKYFDSFQAPSYYDGASLAKTHAFDAVITQMRYEVDKKNEADRSRAAVDFDDNAWPKTNIAVDTWSSLGLHEYFGSMWYRATVSLQAAPPKGKRALVWVGDADGKVRVFVNGREARYAKRPPGPPTPETFVAPLGFDVTELLRAGDNVVAIHARRMTLNELGIGGLVAPVVVAHER
ncbi:MAG: DUF4838 domain-containing protein [Deltaproteobacteria bacterium]|nr:DUF4838 domain-containing protein [Deltaproteobacteria bacterium]